jgi:hypothetical protein
MVMDIALLSEPETRWLARLADAFERPERNAGVMGRILERVGLG